MPILLVVDDEESIRFAFRDVFEEDKVRVLTAEAATEGLHLFREHGPDVVVLDLQLPDGSGLEVFKEIRGLDAKRPVIFITAHGTTETAIEAMKGGAFDYLVKPLDLDRLSQVLDRAFETAHRTRGPALRSAQAGGDRFVGSSPVMQDMCKAIGKIAPRDVNVLILGESGTGKELVARALHQHSPRADRPFVAINCAALPEALLESELFGHEQGAFTGAHSRRLGKFEHCDGGTLFLDEIGDMTPALQAKMLRVLQDQCFERVGGNQTLRTRVRVLAATNQDLEKLIADGCFRKDLYYRLNGVTIRVPPLRDRQKDVAELAHYFLCRFNRELGKDLLTFTPETLQVFQRYPWPGNVRELQGVIKKAMLNASGHVICPDFLPENLQRQAAADSFQRPATHDLSSSPAEGCDLHALVESLLQQKDNNLYARAVEALDRVLLPRVLRHTQGHQTQASELLGISRNTLRQKLRSLGFGLDKVPTQLGGEGEPADG